MPHQQNLSSWYEDNIGVNIAINPSHSKFKKHQLKLKASISVDPIIVDGKIFVLSKDGYLTSFDEISLKQLWSVNLVGKNSKSDYIGGGITYHAGKLFVANGSRRFDVIDANDGNVVFSKQFSDILVTRPIIHGNIAILQTMGNQVYMLDLGNHAIVWDHSGNPETLQGGITINPVITPNGMAILSYTSGQISLIDLSKRAEVWQMDLSSDNTMPEYVAVNLAVAPIIDNSNAYFADNNGKIFKINLDTGGLAWKKDIDDVRTINNTVNALIMTTNGRQVIALDKENGKVMWTTDLSEQGKSRNKWDPINYISTLIVNDMLNIYTSTGEFYVLDLSAGRIVKRSNVGSKLSFVTITDKIRLFYGKDILISEPLEDTNRFKIFDRFKKSPDASTKSASSMTEVIKDVDNNTPEKKKSSWFKPFKFGKKIETKDTATGQN